MSNPENDTGSDDQWEDRADLAWNEFDWERYLREQDTVIRNYVRFYEASEKPFERIDEVAEKMQWRTDSTEDDDEEEDIRSGDDAADGDPDEVYTLHKNPVFIATKAIYESIGRSWETLAADSARVPQPLAMSFLTSLHRGEIHAMQAIHALDFGDYAMAVSLFKRAMSALNRSFALVGEESTAHLPSVRSWRESASSQLFDLREVWLRVIAECRAELDQPNDEEN